MRKVDRDLRDTFVKVRDTFKMLTNQVHALVKEVERGRAQLKSAQEQTETAREHFEAREAYLQELEFLVTGGGDADPTEVLHILAGNAVDRPSKQALVANKFKNRMRYLQDENRQLRTKMASPPDKSNLLEDDRIRWESPSPVALPEMSTSWTLRARPPSSRAATATPSQSSREAQRPTSCQSFAFVGADHTGSTTPGRPDAAHRAVSRVRTIGHGTPPVDKTEKPGLVLKQKMEVYRHVVGYASSASRLLKSLVEELRSSFGETLGSDGFSSDVAPEVLRRIAQLMFAAHPEISTFLASVEKLRPFPDSPSVVERPVPATLTSLVASPTPVALPHHSPSFINTWVKHRASPARGPFAGGHHVDPANDAAPAAQLSVEPMSRTN